jgi:hypothetical protein
MCTNKKNAPNNELTPYYSRYWHGTGTSNFSLLGISIFKKRYRSIYRRYRYFLVFDKPAFNLRERKTMWKIKELTSTVGAVLSIRIRIRKNPNILAGSESESENSSDLDSDSDPDTVAKYFFCEKSYRYIKHLKKKKNVIFSLENFFSLSYRFPNTYKSNEAKLQKKMLGKNISIRIRIRKNLWIRIRQKNEFGSTTLRTYCVPVGVPGDTRMWMRMGRMLRRVVWRFRTACTSATRWPRASPLVKICNCVSSSIALVWALLMSKIIKRVSIAHQPPGGQGPRWLSRPATAFPAGQP